MLPKERFMIAVKGGQPDRVPVFDFLDSKKLFEYTNGRKPEAYTSEDIMQCTMKLGLDAAFIPFGGFSGYVQNLPEELVSKQLKDNQYIDEWGTVYQHNEASWPADAPIEYPIKDRKTLLNYKVPDAHIPGRLDDIKKAIEMNKNGVAILGGIIGPFTAAFLTMGLETISYALYDDPSFVTQVMRMSNEFFMPAVKLMVEAGVDGILLAEDLGYKSGTFANPELMRKYIFPEIERLVKYIKSLNSYVLLHCDGNINSIIDDIVGWGIDALNPIQKSAGMDLGQVKEKYGSRVCLIGNVDSSHILPFGTKQDVIEETINCIKVGAPNGGYILASDSDIRDEMPIENVITMFETAKQHGIYSNNNFF